MIAGFQRTSSVNFSRVAYLTDCIIATDAVKAYKRGDKV